MPLRFTRPHPRLWPPRFIRPRFRSQPVPALPAACRQRHKLAHPDVSPPNNAGPIPPLFGLGHFEKTGCAEWAHPFRASGFVFFLIFLPPLSRGQALGVNHLIDGAPMIMKRLGVAICVFACTMGLAGCCCHQKYYCGSTVSPAFCKPRHFHSCGLSCNPCGSSIASDCGCP